MKNNKKKECKDCNSNEVIEKKIKTMEDGKEYYEKVKEKQTSNENKETSETSESEDERQ